MKRIKIFLLLFLGFSICVCAQEPEWWTKQKKECGLSSKLAYNTWVAQGMPCNTSKTPVNNPSDDEAEALRKKEEADKKAKEEADKKAKDEGEAKRKKEEAERIEAENKKALERMKGSSTGNLGIKTTAPVNDGLKGEPTPRFGLKTLPPPDSPYNNLPPKYRNYMMEADKSVVPPLSWEQIIDMNVEQLRIGQASDKNKYLMMLDNALVGAFDLFASSPTTTAGATTLAGFKVLIIGMKSAIAAMDEAEVIVFSQNATYETMLRYLKDKTKGPQLLAALKSIREKKSMPPGTSPEIARLAVACQSPAAGISSTHIVMNTMLSKQAKWAFFQVAKKEGAELMYSGIRGLVATDVQERIKALRDVNEKIGRGQEFLKTETDPEIRSLLKKKIGVIDEQRKPF